MIYCLKCSPVENLIIAFHFVQSALITGDYLQVDSKPYNTVRYSHPRSRKEEIAIARRVFFSFHYEPDNWRAGQVRDMGVIEGNTPVSDNEWESTTSGGDRAIEKWISDQLAGKSCTIVLIGRDTAGRKWIKYEIEKSWNDVKGLLGIYIHNLKDKDEKQSAKGRNPFDDFTMKRDDRKLSNIVKAYNSPFSGSTHGYNHIKDNLANWDEEAISIRQNY
jgi:hypothetical protein